MPIDPKLIRRKATAVDQSEFVLLALLKCKLMSLSLPSATIICGRVTVKYAFAVQERSHRIVRMVCDFLVEQTESVLVIPVAHKQWLKFYIIVRAGWPSDNHGSCMIHVSPQYLKDVGMLIIVPRAPFVSNLLA